MSVRIVDFFELVHVDDQHRKGIILAGYPADFVLEVAPQETAIVDAGKLVLKDEARGILPHVGQEVDKLCVRHELDFPPPFAHSDPHRLLVEAPPGALRSD